MTSQPKPPTDRNRLADDWCPSLRLLAELDGITTDVKTTQYPYICMVAYTAQYAVGPWTPTLIRHRTPNSEPRKPFRPVKPGTTRDQIALWFQYHHYTLKATMTPHHDTTYMYTHDPHPRRGSIWCVEMWIRGIYTWDNDHEETRRRHDAIINAARSHAEQQRARTARTARRTTDQQEMAR
jgi:hypothetical protein